MNASPNVSSPLVDPFADESSKLYDLIERSIGDYATDKLIADFGGRRLYIPHAPAPGDRVTKSIGLRAALAMARMFGGDRIVVPNACHQARRRAKILAMRADNISIGRIAHKLRCSERYVYKILALERISRGIDAPGPRCLCHPRLVPTPAPSAERFKRGIINGRA
jgi:hypothetical protein